MVWVIAVLLQYLPFFHQSSFRLQAMCLHKHHVLVVEGGSREVLACSETMALHRDHPQVGIPSRESILPQQRLDIDFIPTLTNTTARRPQPKT